MKLDRAEEDRVTDSSSKVTRRAYSARPNYRFLSGDLTAVISADYAFELDESGVYSSASSRSDSPEFRRQVRLGRKSSIRRGDLIECSRPVPSSLPVNIPDWSKILRDDYRVRRRRRGGSLENDFDYGDEDEGAVDGCHRTSSWRGRGFCRFAYSRVWDGP